MSARTAEVIQIKAPIKKQIRKLGGGSQGDFPEILDKVVRRLRSNGYKLVHVTKSYRKEDSVMTDNYWRKEERVCDIEVVWLCTLTIEFEGGFSFHLDFDFWFDYSKMMENLKGDIFDEGFPYTSRDYAREFGRKEADDILEEVEESVEKKVRGRVGGWGRHGVIKEVTDRKSLDICHSREVSISSISELEELRKCLREERERPVEILEESQGEIEEVAKERVEEMIPFSIEPDSLEGFLSFFLWFRKPGGGFEYQLYRFIQENFGRMVDKEEIRDALLRLEVYGYAGVKEVPENIAGRLRSKGIKRSNRFYEVGEERIPGRELFDELKSKVDVGAYLAPLPKRRLVRRISSPDHLVEKVIRKLTRKNYLIQRKVKDFLGRTVKKIKPKRGSRGLGGREREILEESWDFYNVQKDSLDRIQKGKP